MGAGKTKRNNKGERYYHEPVLTYRSSDSCPLIRTWFHDSDGLFDSVLVWLCLRDTERTIKRKE